MTTTTNHTRPTSTPAELTGDSDEARHLERTLRAIRRRHFAVLSTVSDAGFPHAAAVAYDTVGTTLYVHTHRTSRKALNVAANPRAAMVVPVRKLPVGPPFNVQFQARAALLAMDDPEILEHLEAGRLSKITGHGELDEPDGCFLRLRPTGCLHTYGLGVSALAVARDPLHVGPRSAALPTDTLPTEAP